MVKITVDLIRKRSEHNEGEISTLEEISLHQENIDKIELLDKICRNLRILLLQYNLISKIENLNKLKRLEYLNLAINNIEVIENLEGLESLKKLDLTINFIGNLEDVTKLRCNENLEELFLTGNPCTEYEGYREYVITTLPQLNELDGQQVLRSERIKALQRFAETRSDVIREYRKYRVIRQQQIDRYNKNEQVKITEINADEDGENDEKENEKFWKGISHHTPEDRIAIAERTMKIEKTKNREAKAVSDQAKYVPKLFSPDGRPYNVNQAKIPFRLNDEDDPDNIILHVEVYRYLDSSYVDVDVQPTYVRVTIKGKVLQLTLPCEVLVDKSTAKRNVTSGGLLITMPRLNPRQMLGKSVANEKNEPLTKKKPPVTTYYAQPPIPKRQYLEIGPTRDRLDLLKIVEKSKEIVHRKNTETDQTQDDQLPDDFVDNPEVPPLE